MKYARKTVLVDVNNAPNTNKRIEPLTEAINSLVNATEFSRTNYGDSANAVTELDKDLRKILDRKDISLDDKLKLYNQSLSRYLFLSFPKFIPTPGGNNTFHHQSDIPVSIGKIITNMAV